MNEPLSLISCWENVQFVIGASIFLSITPKQRHHLNYIEDIFVAFENKEKGSLGDQNFENDVIMYAMIHAKMYIFVKGAESKRH